MPNMHKACGLLSNIAKKGRGKEKMEGRVDGGKNKGKEKGRE